MIAEATGLSVGGVEKNIRQLKKDGILTHAGSARNGHWEIISANVDEKEMKIHILEFHYLVEFHFQLVS